MFTFYIENHEPYGSLRKNCPKLDKNKSKLSAFSVFVVYKLAVQKSNYVGCFSLVSECLHVFAYIFPHISIKSAKLHFQSWKKFSPTILLLFRKITTEISRNNCAKWH